MVEKKTLETREASITLHIGTKEDTPQAFTTNFGTKVVHAKNVNHLMGKVAKPKSLTITVNNTLNLTKASLTNIDDVETPRSNTIVMEDKFFQGSTQLTMEATQLQWITSKDDVDTARSNTIDMEDNKGRC